jgi:hypothetical protein
LLLDFTLANAGVSGLNLRSGDHDTKSQYGLNHPQATKHNHLGRTIPADAAGSIARLPLIQFFIKNFKVQTTDELLVAFERKLFRNIYASATYTHQKHNYIQDTVPDVMSSDYVCAPAIVTNATTGRNFQTQDCYLPPSIPTPGRTVFLTLRGRTRSYDGLEVALAKKMSSHVLLGFSGTIQNQKIHFPGNSINFGRSYQDSANVSFVNETSQADNYVRNLGWDWSIKANAAYVFPHNVTVGAYFEIVNGLMVPIWRESILFGNNVGEDVGSIEAPGTASLNAVKYIDLKIQKDFSFRKYGKLSLSADIFNVFNMNPTQAMTGNGRSFQFMERQAIVNPRVMSFQLRYSF